MITNLKDGTVSHVGTVLGIGSRDDGLWEITHHFALVWDHEKSAIVEVGTFGQRWGGGDEPYSKAVVDATPEVRELAVAWEAERLLKRWFDAAAREATKVSHDKLVEAVRGRKVPIGTIGQVFWVGKTQWGIRVGLKVTPDSEALWTAISNLEVVDPEDYLPEVAEGLPAALFEAEALWGVPAAAVAF